MNKKPEESQKKSFKEAQDEAVGTAVGNSLIAGCIFVPIGGLLGLGIGWFAFGFLPGLGLGLIGLIAVPLLVTAFVYWSGYAYEEQKLREKFERMERWNDIDDEEGPDAD